MAKIVVERAPPTALPLLFLLTTPAWGVCAGMLLLLDGDAALQTRWAPVTLALVHAFTLGVLGNAMVGSLLQFLPAAAGTQVLGGVVAGRALHAVFNLGAALLVAGMRMTQPWLLMAAAVALAIAFAAFATMVLPGLLRQSRASPWHGSANTALRPTRVGIALAVVAAVATAALGLGLLASWTGHAGLAALPWTDVHAAWGLLGWGAGLVASVGAIVLPMFQGTRPVPARAQYAFSAGIMIVLAAGTACVIVGGSIVPMRLGAAAGVATMALAGLWLQWRARHVRNAWLVRAWRAGLLVLLAAAGALAMGGLPILPGGLAISIGFPWLVAAMQLEIVAFLGWIELHRRCGRGVRLPPVQALLTEVHKRTVFAGFAFAALALTGAILWPSSTCARLAGLALVVSYALLGFRLHGVGRNVRAFIAMRTSPGGREAMLDAH